MSCVAIGDPHAITFSGFHCDLMGLGAFPMVDLPNLRVHTFHCPVRAGIREGASTIAAIAMRAGNDTIVVRGSNVRAARSHLNLVAS